MNKSSAVRKRRAYNNSLREEQAKQSQERILEAVAGMLRAGELEDLSFPSVAKAAGVSVPTVYRYFPSRKALFTGLNEWIRRELKAPPPPHSIEEMVDRIPALFKYLEENRELQSAANVASLLLEANRADRQKRDRHFSKLLAEQTSHLDPAEARAVQAVFRALIGFDAYALMSDRFGVDAATASAAVQWAVRALLARLKADQSRAWRKE